MRVAGTGNGTLTWLLADTQASTQLTIDAATGTTTRRRYTPYGDERPGTSPLPAGTDRGFLGKPEDDSTGLTLLGARPYDPNLGRFLATDPLTTPYDPQHISAYTYARNNPIAYTDPTGLRSTECGTLYACGWQSNVVTRHTRTYTSSSAQRRYYNRQITKHQPSTPALISLSIANNNSRSKPPRKPTTLHEELGQLENIPGVSTPAGIANGAAYAIEGDWVNAGLSWGGAVPAVGWAGKTLFKGFKWLKGLRKGAKKCDNSFVPGTDVALADGTTKNTEDIEVGDKVHATDPKTGKTVARPVLATITTEDDKHFVDLTITTDDGPASIIATTHHPIWSNDHQTWINAGDLKPGTTLRTPDSTHLRVTALHHFGKRQRTHNLTVEGLHTYYVLAGETPVLVHNSNGCINWAANSVKTWGHTFKTHGAGAKNTNTLTDRARSTGNQQGQWLNNDAAAEFLKGLHVEGAGPRSVRLPDGLGQVIMPDGSIVPARAATVVPSPNWLYKTGFPIIGPN